MTWEEWRDLAQLREKILQSRNGLKAIAMLRDAHEAYAQKVDPLEWSRLNPV